MSGSYLFCSILCCFCISCCFCVSICCVLSISCICSILCCFLCAVIERNYSTIIFLIDEVFDLIRFQSCYQSFDLVAVLISFFYCDYVYICFCSFGIRGLICKCIFGYRITSLKCIVSVKDNVRSLFCNTCYLLSCKLNDFYVVWVLLNIVYSCLLYTSDAADE